MIRLKVKHRMILTPFKPLVCDSIPNYFSDLIQETRDDMSNEQLSMFDWI